MSVPPDNFDDGEPPDDEYVEGEFPEEYEEEISSWRDPGTEPADWYYDAQDVLEYMDNNDGLNIHLDPYSPFFDPNDSDTRIDLHIYNENTGEDEYFGKYWTKAEWMEFYYYTLDYYDETSYWTPDYTPDML